MAIAMTATFVHCIHTCKNTLLLMYASYDDIIPFTYSLTNLQLRNNANVPLHIYDTMRMYNVP